MSNCKGCAKPIEWVRTTAGKAMPVDPEPRVTVVTDAGDVITGRTSHFATCPKASQFRGERS